MLLAAARTGVTVAAEGEEAAALAPLPLRTLAVLAQEDTEARSKKQEARRRDSKSLAPSPQSPAPSLAPSAKPLVPSPAPERRTLSERSVSTRVEGRIPNPDSLAVVARWGLRTLGELAALPAADLSERLGQDGIRWQRLARGEDTGPLVPAREEEPFEASLELEWPIADLEPLSFVLTRLLDPLCQRLEHRDRGAAVLHLRLRLVTRDLHLRSLQLPAPMRDPKVLRTLLLLDLESHPAPAGIDAVTLSIDPTPGRIVQESLLTRALPAPELVSTLVARLQALMGEGRCGSPVTVDSYRPGAFAMAPFVVEQKPEARSQKAEGERRAGSEARRGFPNPEPRIPRSRASSPEPRVPSPERVPAPLPPADSRARADRTAADPSACGPIGRPSPAGACRRRRGRGGHRENGGRRPAARAGGRGAAWSASPPRAARGWNRDEWDVALTDGGLYRIFEDRDTGRWFVGAVVD